MKINGKDENALDAGHRIALQRRGHPQVGHEEHMSMLKSGRWSAYGLGSG